MKDFVLFSVCVLDGSYGVYTDISFYRSWIQDQFDAKGGATFTP